MSPYFCINVCKCIHLYSPLFRKKRIKMKKVSFYSQTYEQTSFFLLNLLIQFTAPHAHAHTYICVCARAREISDAVPGITAPIACIYYTQSVHIYTLYTHMAGCNDMGSFFLSRTHKVSQLSAYTSLPFKLQYSLSGLFSSSEPSILPLGWICRWYLVAQ